MSKKMDNTESRQRIVCRFLITHGETAGARIELPEGETLTCGSGIDNDIVVHQSSPNSWKSTLSKQDDVAFFTVLEGSVYRDTQLVDIGDTLAVDDEHRFSVGDTEFQVLYESEPAKDLTMGAETTEFRMLTPGQQFKEKYGSRITMRHVLFGFSVFCVAIGTLSAIYAVTGSVIMVNATPIAARSLLEEKLKNSDVGDLDFKLTDQGNSYLLSGMVDTRDQRNKILEISNETEAKVVLDIQVNDELIESVEDIYRVNGISASAEVLGRGQVRVKTKTNDLNKLDVVAISARRDIPSLQDIQIVNDPPGAITRPKKKASRDPDKRVTLIAAGESAYIMTQDQSRYFVGALLPSGHVVESIKEGIVIVSRDGKKETLKY